MNSREKILSAVKANQPAASALPDLSGFLEADYGGLAHFCKVLEGLGGRIVNIASYADIPGLVKTLYTDVQQVVAADPALYGASLAGWQEGDGRQLEQVDLAIVKGVFGVAENGAVWITEQEAQVRVLPFIAQHLAVVLNAADIVPTMHHAYERIQARQAGFGVFIAGPSKTADIEQSLVLGAHGAKSLTVFLV